MIIADYSNFGGSRICLRGGISSSIPPTGSTIARIESPRLPGGSSFAPVPSQGQPQDGSCLRLDRAAVLGSANLEPLLKVIVNIGNDDAGHGNMRLRLGIVYNKIAPLPTQATYMQSYDPVNRN
jgi:hypothetical protein